MKSIRVLSLGALLALTATHSGSSSADKSAALIPDFSHPFVPGELIVGLKDLATDQVSLMAADYGWEVKKQFRSAPTMVVRSAKDEDIKVLAARLMQDTRVRFVEPNYIIKADQIPDDPRYDELYGLNNSGQQSGLIDADIDAPEAWDEVTGNRKILVGVIDTGVDYTHPDLAANYWTNAGETGVDENGQDKQTNGIDDDGNGYIDDFRGWDFANNDNDPIDDHNHGTHCAGTIGAVGDNGIGVTGVNWEVGLVGIKFLTGSGYGTLEGAVSSIEYATLIGVNLTSNSWGGGGYSQAMADAITKAEEADILFVAAAGNNGTNNDVQTHYPSSYLNDNIIAVAATDRNDQLAGFSNYGETSVDIAAPGVDILSTTKNNTYATYSGTSMATPHVAGAAALVLARFPELSYKQLKERILLSGDANVATSTKTLSGKRLNLAFSTEDDRIAPSAPSEGEVIGASMRSVSLRWRAAGDDGDAGLASVHEVRWSENEIISETDFDAATPVTLKNVSVDSNGMMTGEASGFVYNTEGYLAFRAKDNVGNQGRISPSVPFAVQKVNMLIQNMANSLDGLSIEGTWGLQAVGEGHGTVFTESPEGHYPARADMSLTFDPIEIEQTDIALAFDYRANIERGYDFGHVEIKTDIASNWVNIKKITDVWDWTEANIELSSYLQGASSFQIRFRFTSDADIQKDGWMIDNVTVIAAQQ